MAEQSDPMFDKYGVIFKPGTFLFCEWERGDDFYMIKSGRVVISKIVNNQEKTLDEIKAGDVLGEMAILDDRPRTANAEAVTEVEAYRFDRSNFDAFLTKRPEIGLKLLRTMARRIFDAKRRIQILRLTSDEDKILDTLLMLAERNGATNETRKIHIENTEEDIANWSSVALEPAKKILRSLQASGRIGIEKDRILITNFLEMARFIASKRKAVQGHAEATQR